jgi:hypothetical protein
MDRHPIQSGSRSRVSKVCLGQFRIEKGFRGRAGSNGKDQENDLERPGKKQGKGEGTGSSEKEPKNNR